MDILLGQILLNRGLRVKIVSKSMKRLYKWFLPHIKYYLQGRYLNSLTNDSIRQPYGNQVFLRMAQYLKNEITLLVKISPQF